MISFTGRELPDRRRASRTSSVRPWQQGTPIRAIVTELGEASRNNAVNFSKYPDRVVQFGARDDEPLAGQHVRMKRAGRKRGAGRGDEHVAVLELRRAGLNQVELDRPGPQGARRYVRFRPVHAVRFFRRENLVPMSGASAGTTGFRRRFWLGLRFGLRPRFRFVRYCLEVNRSEGALAKTNAQLITMVLVDQSRLPVNQGQRPGRAGIHALTAAGAFFGIDVNSFHGVFQFTSRGRVLFADAILVVLGGRPRLIPADEQARRHRRFGQASVQ